MTVLREMPLESTGTIVGPPIFGWMAIFADVQGFRTSQDYDKRGGWLNQVVMSCFYHAWVIR